MRLALCLALILPVPVVAQAVRLPDGAEVDPVVVVPGGAHDLPAGPYRSGGADLRTYNGERTDRVARLMPPRSVDAVTDDLLATLEGYDIVFDCVAAQCGGFDFRFALDVAPEPGMHVDIADYRYVLAENDDEAVALLVSRSSVANFVQVTEIGSARAPLPTPATEPLANPITLPEVPLTLAPVTQAPDAGEVVAALEADGHAVLEDLTFATGSSELGEGTFASLAELGAWLAENPAVLIGIVGHTDAVGGLDANIALSKRRAESVAARLVSTYGIDRSRIEALGAGYLSPRATNQTEEGREANRRVEVILTAVQ